MGFRLLADFLFPLSKRCAVCASETAPPDTMLCRSCFAHFRKPFYEAYALCKVCGRPTYGTSLCPQCAEFSRSFDRAYPASIFEGAVRSLIHGLKYGSRPDLAIPLSCLMLDAIPADTYDLVVPVPLHALKLARRGYNQAMLLAREIGSKKRVRVFSALVKTGSPRDQASLGRVSRFADLHGTFSARIGAKKALDGAKALLVDDVFTTGATVQHCAEILKNCGASTVDVCVAALAVTKRRKWQ